jgi:hypothetical protein
MKTKTPKYPCPNCLDIRPIFYVELTSDYADCICRVCGTTLWLEPINHINTEQHTIYTKTEPPKLSGKLF